MARLKGMYNVLNHVPGKLHRIGNHLGENVSRKASLNDLDRVSEQHDRRALAVKEEVEWLLQGGYTTRSMKAIAIANGIKGASLFSDNVGKVKSAYLCTY